jgi:organic hydroperoxide reductase OsmC/OhrA
MSAKGGPVNVMSAKMKFAKIAFQASDAPEAKIRDLAEKAKAGCPISKLLRAEITMEVTVG